MANRRFEMYEIRQIIARFRLGESDRDVARAQRVGRKTVAGVRKRAQVQGWLDAASMLPEDTALSPALANLTLEGLEATVQSTLSRHQARGINRLRYADDFIIAAKTQALLETHVLPVVNAFLAQRALALWEEKTRVLSIHSGFNFLGFHFRKYRGKRLIRPQKDKVLAFVKSLTDLVRQHTRSP